jgi:hypothetical protein
MTGSTCMAKNTPGCAALLGQVEGAIDPGEDGGRSPRDLVDATLTRCRSILAWG